MKQNINPLAAVIAVLMTLGCVAFIFYWLNRDKPVPTEWVDPIAGRGKAEAALTKAGVGPDGKPLPGGPAVKPPGGAPKSAPAAKPTDATK